jgi:hypothetical protein
MLQRRNECRTQENWIQMHETYLCSVKGDMCRITTLRKIPPWVKVSDRKEK